MKKLFLLLSLIIITSCSTSDDDNRKPEKNYFNPPTWIHGLWREPNSGASFTFNQNNVICILNQNMINFNQSAIDIKEDGSYVNVQESITNDTYIANFQYEQESILLSFTKKSSTEIESKGFIKGTFIKQ